MQRRLRIFGLVLLSMFSMITFAQKPAATQAEYVEGVVRVKLQPEVVTRMNALPAEMKAGRTVKVGVKQLDAAAQKVKAFSMTRVFPHAGKYEEKHRKYGLHLWYDIKFDEKTMNAKQVQNLYKGVAGVTKVQRIPVYKPIGGGKAVIVSADKMAEMAKAAEASRAGKALPFNDPLLGEQWHYNNTAQYQGMRRGADINLFNAWESGVYGSKKVVVAIIDGGFDIEHPDLKDNLWINQAELNGKPGVDDDGDGYVDDIYGYNFVINSPNINAHEHGTHVAGTVGATNGNGIGVCGVAGGNDGTGGVKMMVCQVFDSRASSEVVTDFGAALVYAADMGASIAQCSWGQSSPDIQDEAANEGVRYFTREGGGEMMNGGLCIFASGNNGEEGRYYPGCLDECVAVGSLAPDGAVAYYSNYGDWVDVTAPGGLMDNGKAFGVLSTMPNGTYGYFEGTSMACPHVSGIAALILSKYGSKDFSNETLRTMLTTSVNDLYRLNPEYEGKMGSGYIDAYKALQGKVGAAPGAVKSFTLTPSHDDILIEWVVPDCEEKVIDHHVVYYSTEPFTAQTDLSTVNRVSVDTKFMTSGDNVAYELKNLKASTKYYIAIVAYSRWGQAAEMSPVKSAATNAGPAVTVSPAEVTMDIDGAGSKVAEASFNLTNSGEGMLKYELTTATQKSTFSTMSVKKDFTPNPGQIVKHSGSMRAAVAKQNEIVTSDFKAGEWPKEFSFGNTFYAYIGETDLTLPNAEAQYFWVDPSAYPDGFNLSHIRVGGSYGENPEIEIYDGSRAINVASLIQKVSYPMWGYNTDIALEEQINFPANSSFWVVLKFPAGYKNPLGVSMTDGTDYSSYSFYSSDNGVTWTRLNEVLKGSSFESVADQLTWSITAVSKNPDWSAVLNPDPISGEIRPGQTQQISLKNDGQQMVNGTYKFNVKVKSNEAVDSKQKVAVSMTVKGYKPEMHSAQLVDFGDVLVGQSKTLDIELVNNGFGSFTGAYGDLYSSNINVSSDQFSVSENICKAVAARSTGKISVTYQPTREGSCSGTVTLTDKDGNKHSFMVRGTSAIPAKLVVAQDEYDLGDLEVGQEKTATLTLKNEGKYPLQYVFPKFSSQKIEGTTAKVHKFGYTAVSNVNGSADFEYQPAPELADETDITKQFNNNSTWFSQAVPVGFKFPFYGKDYSQVYVSSYGGVSMVPLEEGRHFSCIVPSASCVEETGYISGFAGSGWLTLGNRSKVSYGHKDGNLYVKFQNVQTPTTDGEYMNVSFHMVLCPDGSVEVHYDDYDPYMVMGSGTYNFVGVCDYDAADPYVFVDADKHSGLWYENPYYDLATGSAVKIVAPAKSMIKSVSSTDGYVGIGESKDITVTVAGNDDLNAGKIANYLSVLTNDPVTPSKNITLKANIVGENLKPEAKLDEETVDFGNVFRTSVQNRNVLLHNDGKNVLNVTSVAVKNGKFAVADDAKNGFSVPAGQGKDIVVTLPTETEGAVEDILAITYQDGTSAEVVLKGNVVGVPVMAVNPDFIEVETPYGVNAEQNLAVSNSGNEKLEFSIEPDTWFNIKNLEADDVNSKVDYIFKSKTEGDDVKYEWKDITEDYDAHMPYSYYIDKTDYKEVELPFEFPFYGQNYKKMYIYNTGFVSFDKPIEDYKQFPEPPISLPTKDTFYSNIICPFWGNHSMATASSDGVYYKENGDEVVVSYMNYNNSMMLGMNFQVIIRKNGTFKFQYMMTEDGFLGGIFGLAGVMNKDNTRGYTVSESYIAPGNAVEVAPVKTFSVAPAQSVDVPLEILADELGSVYEHVMNVTTNVPGNETVMIPAVINITGETGMVIPEKVEIDHPIDPMGMPSYTEFAIENKGTKAFTIYNMASQMFEAADPDDPWSMPMAQLEVYMDPNQAGDGGVAPLSVSTHDTEMAWIPYISYGMPPITVGKDPVKFRIAVYNTMETVSAEYPLYIDLGEEEPVTSVIKLNITEAPGLAFEDDALYINNVDGSYKGTLSTRMMNIGAYKLKYSLRLDASGRDEIVEDIWGGDGGDIDPLLTKMAPAMTKDNAMTVFGLSAIKIDAKTMAKAMGIKKVRDNQKYYLDVPENFEHNVLYHPVLDPVSNAVAAVMGTGNSHLDENFYAATRYEAPAEGFNLTHLYFTGTVGTLEDVDIEATVILGNDVTAKDKTIGHGKIHVDYEEPGKTGYIGIPRMLEFDKPIYINPADTFYVVLKYPAGYGSSALMASKDGAKEPGRYMGNSKALGGWLDLEETFDIYYAYGSFGYFMTCVEMEKGEPWIKLLNAETEGEVAPGESMPLSFSVDAGKTYFTKNNVATLIVNSNDPFQKVVNYHIYLDKNGAPVITAPESIITVPEGDKAIVTIPVADAEGDAFDVTFSDENGIGSIESYANAEGTQDGITFSDGTFNVEAGKSLVMNVALAPDYETEGIYKFSVAAADEKGNKSEAEVKYNVEHTNRAPIFSGVPFMIVGNGRMVDFKYSSLFNDPDGDAYTCTISCSNNSVAEIFESADGFALKGKKAGTATLTVIATDTNGASTTATVNISVLGTVGIDEASAGNADVTVNAAANVIEATLGTDAADAVLNIYDNAGKLVQSKTMTNVHAGETVVLASGRPAGVYHLVATLDGKITSVKFVVK